MVYIVFPHPGDWGKYKIVSQWVDDDGYTHTETCRILPAEFQPVMQQVVSSIEGLAAPWQAVLVQGKLVRAEDAADMDEVSGTEPQELVELTVHARRVSDGASKVFTSADYAEFRLADAAAISFYKHFTHQS